MGRRATLSEGNQLTCQCNPVGKNMDFSSVPLWVLKWPIRSQIVNGNMSFSSFDSMIKQFDRRLASLSYRFPEVLLLKKVNNIDILSYLDNIYQSSFFGYQFTMFDYSDFLINLLHNILIAVSLKSWHWINFMSINRVKYH